MLRSTIISYFFKMLPAFIREFMWIGASSVLTRNPSILTLSSGIPPLETSGGSMKLLVFVVVGFRNTNLGC